MNNSTSFSINMMITRSIRGYFECAAQALSNISIQDCPSDEERRIHAHYIVNIWYWAERLLAGTPSSDYVRNRRWLGDNNLQNVISFMGAAFSQQAVSESKYADVALFTQYRGVIIEGILTLCNDLPLVCKQEGVADLYLKGCEDASHSKTERDTQHYTARIEQLKIYKGMIMQLVGTAESTPYAVARKNLELFMFMQSFLRDFEGSSRLPEYLSVAVALSFDRELYNIIFRYFWRMSQDSVYLPNNTRPLTEGMLQFIDELMEWLLAAQDSLQPAVPSKGVQSGTPAFTTVSRLSL